MSNPRKIKEAAKARAAAEARFVSTIRAAYATGRFSLAELATAAGVTRQRVWQIINNRR
jgi:hypothetical protein